MNATNKEKLDLIFELEAGLTCWEIDFCEDISKKLDSERTLSEKQQDVLDRIYAEKAY